MMKLKSKLSLVMLLVLSFVILVGAAVSMLVKAEAMPTDAGLTVSVNESWFEIDYDDDSLTILLDADFAKYSELKKDDVVKFKNAISDAIQRIIVDKLLESDSSGIGKASFRLSDRHRASTIADVEDVLGKYKDKLIERLKEKDENGVYEVEKYLSGEYDAVIKFAVAQYLEEHADFESKLDEIQNEVRDTIDSVITDLQSSAGWDEQKVSGYKEQNSEKVGEIVEEVAQIVENGGTVSFSLSDLLDMLRKLTVNEVTVFDGKFSADGIKEFLNTLPKLSEIAEMEEVKFDFSIAMETSLGNSEFNVTIGFRGDCSGIKRAAKFIADHIDVYTDASGKHHVNVTVPDEFSAIFTRISNSDYIPDDLKHSIFDMYGKTGSELSGELSDFTYDKLIEYLKSTDFRGIFANLIDAEKLQGYFAGYDIDLSEFSQEKIDNFINKVFDYLGKISKNQSVEGVEDLLSSFGIKSEKLNDAVEKFLKLLKEIDFEYWNAQKVKDFIQDEDAFNKKFDELIQRAAESVTAKNLYEKFIDLSQSLLNRLPETLKSETIIDLYAGDCEIAWDGNVNVDVKGVLSSILNRVAPYLDIDLGEYEGYDDYVNALIGQWFSGDLNYDLSVSLNIKATGIHKVEYKYEDRSLSAGLLPEGADIEFYANSQKIDGRNVLAWIDEEGNAYTKMPASDITLYALTEFDVVIYNGSSAVKNIEKLYDGKPVELTAKAEKISAEFTGNLLYQWYKNGKKIDGATQSTLTLQEITDSGSYQCEMYCTLEDGTLISVKSRNISVNIKKLPIDLSGGEWQLVEGDDYIYSGSQKTVNFVLPEDYEGKDLIGEIFTITYVGNTATDAGVYYAYIEVNNTNPDLYEVLLPDIGYDKDHAFKWEIKKFELKVDEIPTLTIYRGSQNFTGNEVTYDGSAYNVRIGYKTNNDNLVATIDQSSLTKTDAGAYFIDIIFSIKQGSEKNFVYYGTDIYTCVWKIARANLNLKNSYWAYGDNDTRYEDNSFIYDGENKTVKFVLKADPGQTIPSGITVTGYKNNTYKDVNETYYTATATIDYSESVLKNYIIEGPGPVATNNEPDRTVTLNWNINPANLELNGVDWDYPEAFVYDGEAKEVKLNNIESIELPNGVELVYSGNSATDAGTYRASVTLNTLNYRLVIIHSEIVWQIKKAQINLSEYEWKWSADSFVFESGVTRTVELDLTGLTEELEFVKYSGNSQTGIGRYTARAYFAVKTGLEKNYEIADANYVEHIWTIVSAFGGGDGVYDEKEIKVGDTTVKVMADVSDEIWETLTVAESTANYSSEQFNPWAKAGTHAELVKVYSISMNIPSNYSGYILISVSDGKFENIDPATVHIPGGTSEINTETCEGLSTSYNGTTVSFYTTSFSDFVVINQVADEKDNLWWVWVIDVLILIVLIIIIILIIVLLLKKKKGNEQDKDDSTMVIIDAPEEENEDDSSEDIDDEFEESDEDDDDSDDETAIAEDAGEAAVSAAVAVAPVASETDERSIYNKSFTARLSQADEIIKSYYSDLKNYILAYKGVKSRISWNFDTFNKGREKCIKLQIRGKSLYMYIALNPKDLDEKYHIKDVSEMSRYASVPTMLRIKKPRSLKYAKELIDKLMENIGVERGETPNVQYKIDYKSTEALLQVGLIKIKVSKNSFEDINKNNNNSNN